MLKKVENRLIRLESMGAKMYFEVRKERANRDENESKKISPGMFTFDRSNDTVCSKCLACRRVRKKQRNKNTGCDRKP